MKNILIVSNSDTCRSRMAQEILNSFGRGMKISTAGVLVGNSVPRILASEDIITTKAEVNQCN